MYMYDRLNPHLTLSHVLNHCDKSSHQPSCSECYVQIFLLVSTRNNMLVLPKTTEITCVCVSDFMPQYRYTCACTDFNVWNTKLFAKKKLVKRKKKTAFLRMKHDFYYFPYLVIDPDVDSSI